jgi:hypothetical protein
MSYELSFSDPGNLSKILVPEYPPGINAIDTSLSFAGKGYPNYGRVVDQNFLKLLENFAGPVQPNSPIKGQLWYDSYSRSLRLFDGNAWKSANNIYQQDADPADASPVSKGDIWVDTLLSVLKIRGIGEWIEVGPPESQGVGLEISRSYQDSQTNAVKDIVLIKSDGKIVAIFNGDNSFVPNPSIPGITEIAQGITIPSGYILSGTADNANNLGGFDAAEFLRKDDTSVDGQSITGKVVYLTPPTSGQEGRDGVIVKIDGDTSSEYIQFFKKSNDAVLSNNVQGGKLIVKVKGPIDVNQTNALVIEKNLITIAGDVTVNNGVVAATTITGTLSVGPQPNITSVGTLTNIVSGNLSATTATISNLNVTDLTVFGRAVLPPIYTAGMLQLWAGSTSTSVPLGWLVCDGSEVSTSTYSSLYEAIGAKYGVPTTPGTFRLPNLVESVPLPPGDPRGANTSSYYIIKQD